MRLRTTQYVVLPLLRERPWILRSRELVVEVVAVLYRLFQAGEDVTAYLDMVSNFEMARGVCREMGSSRVDCPSIDHPRMDQAAHSDVPDMEHYADFELARLFALFQHHTSPALRSAFRLEFFAACGFESSDVLYSRIIRDAFASLFFRKCSDPLVCLLSSDLSGVGLVSLHWLVRAAIHKFAVVEEGGLMLRSSFYALVDSAPLHDLLLTLVRGRDFPQLWILVKNCNASSDFKLVLFNVLYSLVMLHPQLRTLYSPAIFNFMLEFSGIMSDLDSLYGLIKAESGVVELRIIARECLLGNHREAIRLINELMVRIETRKVSYRHEDVQLLMLMRREAWKEGGAHSSTTNYGGDQFKVNDAEDSFNQLTHRFDCRMHRLINYVTTADTLPPRELVESLLSTLKMPFPSLSGAASRQALYVMICSEILEVLTMRNTPNRPDSIYGRLRLWNSRFPLASASNFEWSLFMRWRLLVAASYAAAPAKQASNEMAAPPMHFVYAAKLRADGLYRHASAWINEIPASADPKHVVAKQLYDLELLYESGEYSTGLALVHSLNVGKLTPEEKSLLYYWAGKCLRRMEGNHVSGDKCEAPLNRYEVLSRRLSNIMENKKEDIRRARDTCRKSDYLSRLADLINELPIEESREWMMDYLESGGDSNKIDEEKVYYFMDRIGGDERMAKLKEREARTCALIQSELIREASALHNSRTKLLYFTDSETLPGEYSILRNEYRQVKMMSYMEILSEGTGRIRNEDGMLYEVCLKRNSVAGIDCHVMRAFEYSGWLAQLNFNLARSIPYLTLYSYDSVPLRSPLPDSGSQPLRCSFYQLFGSPYAFYNFRSSFLANYSDLLAAQYSLGAVQNDLRHIWIDSAGLPTVEFVEEGHLPRISAEIADLFGPEGLNGILVKRLYVASRKLAGEKVLRAVKFFMGCNRSRSVEKRAKTVLEHGAESAVNEMLDPRTERGCTE